VTENYEANSIHSREKRSTKAVQRGFRERLDAKRRGLSESACPYIGDDSYATYLRAHWSNGYNSRDGINHHATETWPL